MEPVIHPNETFAVDTGAYKTGQPHRGDIVVFASPPPVSIVAPGVADLVKRIIGLPGETLSSESGHVLVNGVVLNERWLAPGTFTIGVVSHQVPANHYDVLGDNRTNSQDSRFFGPIPASTIVGKVVLAGCGG